MACASRVVHSADNRPQAWLLDNGKRLHLQHGPIDLIIDAQGLSTEVRMAYRQATHAFQTVLVVLASQLPVLRTVMAGPEHRTVHRSVQGEVARRMVEAAGPLHSFRVTPMIAVAGAVADHVCQAMLAMRKLERVLVNNGGDIALFLGTRSSCRIGIADQVNSTSHPTFITLNRSHGVAGIATSGWQGRSHSLGIADAVTVLAADSATADAAATIIANAVDLPGSAKIQRVPANDLSPDSDLDARAVTVGVDRLDQLECRTALDAGVRLARQLLERGLIKSAYLHLQGRSEIVGRRFENQKAIQSISQLSGCRT